MKKITLIAASVALALGLVACDKAPQTAAPETAAVTPAKTLVSGVEKENFDAGVKHTENFFYSINGTWLKNTEIPADKSNYGAFTKLYDDSQLAMRTIIETAAKKEGKVAGTDEQKLGDFYNSYMNESAIEALGVKPISADLTAIAAIKDATELASSFGQLQGMGVSIPLGWYVNNDAKNSTQYAVYLGQSGLGLPDRDYYIKDDEKSKSIRDAYVAYVKDMLTLAGVADAENAAARIMALETKIAEKQWSRVENRDADKTYNKFAAADLAKLLGGFPWADYAKAVQLDTASEIIVEQPTYFEAFGAIYKETDLQSWKDYLALRLVSEYSGKLSKAFVDRQFDFYGKTLSGTTEQQPRWKKAVNASDEVLGEIVGKLYVADHFKPEAKARMEVLVQNLIKAYHASIDTLEWMTPETKKAAHEKLNKFTPKIGYPDKWKDYSKLDIKADDLVGNYKAAAAFAYSEMRNKLGKPVDRSEWFMTPQTVNAYYNPTNNEIVFPAAILQPPFFNMDADDAVNYGGIGAVIGHELGHGFDDQGAKFDGDGNLRNWWTDADKAEFEKRGKQLVEQYNQYSPLEGMHVNGELTLGENIGDLGGLTVALKAYKLSLEGKEAAVLDGFTGEQRFFISWSQVWRRKGREEYLRNMLMTDPHSPSEYRVIGIVSNIPEFYTAFDVKEGDKMYIAPEKRVKIW
ncbi:MAG: peptidase M13 [Gammaproteobacteria bacterium]|nr:peptidase M13 [Gammaproteobacteria bacterium]